MIGDKFGRWTVVSKAPSRSYGASSKTQYNCKCECGKEKEVLATSLRTGKSLSCGCLQIEAVSKLKHGMSKTAIYKRWKEMKNRCHNIHSPWYEYYGGRGIRVGEAWHSFEIFYADMGDPPFEGATIERIDNNGNYTLSNCVWATRKQQVANRRQH